MALAYNYYDPYLLPFVTQELETEAIDDVAAIYPSFSAEWVAKLAPLRTYILICQRSSVDETDSFAAKLKVYTKEYASQIVAANKNTTDASTGFNLNSLSIPVGRG